MRRNLASGFGPRAAVKLLIAGTFFVLVILPIGQYVQLTGPLRAVVLLAALFGPMLIGVPVALSLGFMATFYIGAFGDVPFNVGAMQIYNGLNLLALMAIPLLILAGKLMHEAGIAQYIVDFAQVLVGRLRGGLGAANVVASFLFGDISGSAVSDTAAIGSLMIPQMKKRGYRADFCAALQGTAGTLGMMAPLAITILLYASATNTSVSRLAAATILPAFLLAGSFMLVTLIHARRHNYPREHVPRETIVPRTLRALPGLFALVLVVGGILGGVFTPAEVGSVLLAYVLVLSFFYRTAQPKRLYHAVVEAGYISGMTLFMASTSSFLGFVMARDLVSQQVVEFVTQISTDRIRGDLPGEPGVHHPRHDPGASRHDLRLPALLHAAPGQGRRGRRPLGGPVLHQHGPRVHHPSRGVEPLRLDAVGGGALRGGGAGHHPVHHHHDD